MSDVRVCHCFFVVVDRVIVDYLINIYINIIINKKNAHNRNHNDDVRIAAIAISAQDQLR